MESNDKQFDGASEFFPFSLTIVFIGLITQMAACGLADNIVVDDGDDIVDKGGVANEATVCWHIVFTRLVLFRLFAWFICRLLLFVFEVLLLILFGSNFDV